MTSSRLAELVAATGYAADTPLAVAVGTPSSEPALFAQGVGRDGLPLGSDSVAYAASLAKQFTGTCAALLERRSVLDPDAWIAEWLPELPPWRERVRVRHLIHHTAGLPDVCPRLEQAGDEDRTSQAMLAALADSPRLANEPGSAYAYSNEGYICLATIVERISGVTLDEFARTHIFEPLSMTRSLFWAGPSPAPPTAAVMPAQHGRAPLSVGDGGLWTSVGDLLRWNAAMLDDTLGIAARIHAPGSLDDGTPLDYACGVHVFDASGQTVQSHGGDYGTATAKLVRVPARRVGFAALAADASVDRMACLGDAVLRELIDG